MSNEKAVVIFLLLVFLVLGIWLLGTYLVLGIWFLGISIKQV
jgi:hypothetical protein